MISPHLLIGSNPTSTVYYEELRGTIYSLSSHMFKCNYLLPYFLNFCFELTLDLQESCKSNIRFLCVNILHAYSIITKTWKLDLVWDCELGPCVNFTCF